MHISFRMSLYFCKTAPFIFPLSDAIGFFKNRQLWIFRTIIPTTPFIVFRSLVTQCTLPKALSRVSLCIQCVRVCACVYYVQCAPCTLGGLESCNCVGVSQCRELWETEWQLTKLNPLSSTGSFFLCWILLRLFYRATSSRSENCKLCLVLFFTSL